MSISGKFDGSVFWHTVKRHTVKNHNVLRHTVKNHSVLRHNVLRHNSNIFIYTGRDNSIDPTLLHHNYHEFFRTNIVFPKKAIHTKFHISDSRDSSMTYNRGSQTF